MQVDFHSGVADKLGHTCRLLRKALRRGSRVQVCGQPRELDTLDQALWTMEAQDFLPHLRWRGGEAPAPALHRTPVWLVDSGMPWPHGLEPVQVLVNLGPEPPGEAELSSKASRVIEIVGCEADEVQSGRRRWRFHVQQGWQPTHHAFTGEQA